MLGQKWGGCHDEGRKQDRKGRENLCAYVFACVCVCGLSQLAFTHMNVYLIFPL